MTRRAQSLPSIRLAGKLATLGFAVGFAAPVAAQEIKVPADPVGKAAFEVLDKHCARCHQEGRLTGRERPAKGFGNVLKLDELAETPSLVLPGNPHGSKLFKQIVDREMPYDVIYEGSTNPDISEAELKTLETWIASLGTGTVGRKIAVEPAPGAPSGAAAPAPAAPPASAAPASPPAGAPPAASAAVQPPAAATPVAAAGCDAHKFVSNKDMIALMAADLDRLPKARQRGTRYLTLTHFTNVCAKEKALEVYRQGAIKLVNSLSRSADVVRLETIDPDQSILRINIDDLGWDAADWEAVVAVYPYGLLPDTQLTGVLQSATGTRLAHVRADWFAFTAARPGLYERLLKLPKTFQALAREQGVDIENNIKRFIAQRSGFQNSGVSKNNRLIERHPSRSGYFWTSYDFSGNKGRQSLFEHPMGPSGANAFQHDGGETIFSLPNGFQAYYLNTSKGDLIAKGPTEIVLDPERKDKTVTNGISCMGCHDQGMRKAKDQVRASVLQNRAHSREVREAVEALYPPTEKMDQLIAGDGKRFADAMVRAGLNPTLKLNGTEMINALSDRYEADVDGALAAAELGMTVEEFKSASADADRRLRSLVRRLEQGAVPRDQFEAVFVQLARDITDEQPVQVAAPAPGAPGQPAVAKVTANADLSLISDRDVYKLGDTPIFTVQTSRDCFLTMTNIDDKGVATVIFPNKFQQDNRIRAKVPTEIPGASAPFQFRLGDRGTEQVLAVCSLGKGEVDGIKHDFGRQAFTQVGDYTRSIAKARQIQVLPKGTPAAPAPQPVAGVPAGGTFRAAIKIEVR